MYVQSHTLVKKLNSIFLFWHDGSSGSSYITFHFFVLMAVIIITAHTKDTKELNFLKIFFVSGDNMFEILE